MTRYLHSLSAVLFYLLGSSAFAAFVLLRNNQYGLWPGWWLATVALPLLVVGLLYGGTSVYLSMHAEPQQPARGLAAAILIPLVIFFILSLILHFNPIP